MATERSVQTEEPAPATEGRPPKAIAESPGPTPSAHDRPGQSAPLPKTEPPANGPTALFAQTDTEQLHSRWTEIQAGFVDEPRRAVEQADALVADVMTRLAQVFSHERETLEHQWDQGDYVTTEDLRVALQRYRSFFDRLLSV